MISFQLRGMEGLLDELDELGAQLAARTLAKAARKAFAPVLEDAKRFVPKNSGALAESLKLSVKKPGSGDAVVIVGIKVGNAPADDKELPPARRWHFVELGTSKMPAHPYLRPALDANADKVLELLRDELVKAILKARRKK